METIIMLGISTFVTFFVFLIAYICNIIHLRYIDNTTYIYERFNDKNLRPICLIYKGHKITIEIQTQRMEKSISCYDMERINFLINEKPIACLSRLESTFVVKRTMFLSSKYDTSEFYKILRAARKTYYQNIHERFEAETKDPSYKLY